MLRARLTDCASLPTPPRRARDRKLTEEGAAPSGSDAEADDEDRGRMVFGLGTRSDAPGQLGPQVGPLSASQCT